MAAQNYKIVLTAENKTQQAIAGVKKNLGDLNKTGLALRSAFSGLFAGVSTGLAVGKLVETQRQFDILNSSLVTVTGSVSQAEKEFAWIKEFAATTPFDLEQVTNAFVKMKAFGLDASLDALTAYGNTAAATGKSLDQMIEAVADAATGEFERLKEFGIRARKQGDEVTFTFRGISKTVRQSSEEITEYLQSIGENDFAGAMATRAKTLDGALSNLGDTWNELFRTINDAGVGQLIFDATALATQGVQNLINNIKVLQQYAAPQGQMRVDALVSERTGLQAELAKLEGRGGDVAATTRADLQRRIEKINAEVGRLQDEWIRAQNAPATPAMPPRPDAGGTAGTGGGGGKGGARGKSDAEREYQAIEKQLQALRSQAETFGLSEKSATLYKLALDGATEAQLANAEVLLTEIDALEERSEAQKRLADLLGTTNLEKQRTDMQLLAGAYLEGAISVDEYGEAVGRALGNIEPVTDQVKDQFDDLKRAIEGWGRDSAEAIVDFAVTGKSSFSDMIDSMLADLARMLVQQNVTGPLAQVVSGFDFAGMFGFASGGVMTSAGPLPLRAYASGGVANSPQLALYGEGSRPEAYVPLPDGRTIPVTMKGAGTVVKVDVHNNAGPDTRATATATTDSTGNTQIMVMVEKIEGMMGRRIGQGGGLAPMLEGRYGLNPAAGARR